jgi:hypothetical protein
MTPCPALTYSKQELQEALRTPSQGAFVKRLAQLEAEGFPRRLPACNGQRALWSKPAVDQWLANWGSTATHHTTPTFDHASMRLHLEKQYV